MATDGLPLPVGGRRSRLLLHQVPPPAPQHPGLGGVLVFPDKALGLGGGGRAEQAPLGPGHRGPDGCAPATARGHHLEGQRAEAGQVVVVVVVLAVQRHLVHGQHLDEGQ